MRRKTEKAGDVKIIDEETVSHDVLASAIVEIAAAAKKVLTSRITESALLILIKHAIPNQYGKPGVSQATIRKVLYAAADLEKRYVRR